MRRIFLCAVLLLAGSLLRVAAQDTPPPVPQATGYVAPEQLISITGDTPFDKAMAIFSKNFKRFESKPLIYEGNDTKPITVDVASMYWRDAFELVLRYNNHWFTENEDYIRVFSLDKGKTGEATVSASKAAAQAREVEISAIFFEANRGQMEQLGIDWMLTQTAPSAENEFQMNNAGLFTNQQSQNGGSSGSSGSSSSSGSSGTQSSVSDFGLKSTLHVFNRNFDILGMLKAIQSNNLGELISRPAITVRSGETGRIQVGSDFSVKQRDFSGNTIDKFFSTGTIIEVTPEVMSYDSTDFVNLKISAERSSVIPDPVSTIINKTQANTSVLLMNQEETMIGGLFTNDVQKVRRGVPILKDLPWWFFGLRYLFGYEDEQVTKKELIIILKARIVPPIEKRLAEKIAEAGDQNALERAAVEQENERNRLLDQIERAKAQRK
jgi:general secretion pathway protein D